MEDIFWGGIMFMRPLCGKEGLGWDYKVLDFWLWEVLPFDPRGGLYYLPFLL